MKNHEELKKVVGTIENVMRGKEELIRGLVLNRASSGCVGRRRKKRILNVDTAPDTVLNYQNTVNTKLSEHSKQVISLFLL